MTAAPDGASSRRLLLFGAGSWGLAAACAAAAPRRLYAPPPTRSLADLISSRAGPWAATDAAGEIVPDPLNEPTDRGQTLTRIYLGPDGAGVQLSASYHAPDSRDVKVHPPELCYAVAGFRISDARRVRLDLGEAGTLEACAFEAERPLRRESVLYWARINGRLVRDMAEQRLAVLGEALAGRRSEGFLVRLSTTGADRTTRLSRLETFAAAFVRAAGPSERGLLFGRTGGGRPA